MEKLLEEYTPVFAALGQSHFSGDDDKIEAAINDKAGPFIAKIEERLSKNKFLGGDKLVVADFWIGSMYTDKCVNRENKNAKAIECWAALLKKYPNFKRYGEDFIKENSDWMHKRLPHAL